MFFFRKNNKNKTPPAADNNNLPSDVTPPPKTAPEKENAAKQKQNAATPPAKKKRKGFREMFNEVVRDVRSMRGRDLRDAALETLRDMRKPKDLVIAVVAIIIPGGTLPWVAYRLKKFKSGQAANDNPPPAENPPAPEAKKKPSRKRGPKGP